ncbi:hypothetical protein AA309_11530 [Microvirga vignae]|uniref:Uncharacterized protein n=1 Tax=Microvirga vignae TaxID=1225564 RepID=A0A0H1RDN3_9HYPH|nr:hypothetical protein AA309_11530 [Microvirga vignae]
MLPTDSVEPRNTRDLFLKLSTALFVISPDTDSLADELRDLAREIVERVQAEHAVDLPELGAPNLDFTSHKPVVATVLDPGADYAVGSPRPLPVPAHAPRCP